MRRSLVPLSALVVAVGAIPIALCRPEADGTPPASETREGVAPDTAVEMAGAGTTEVRTTMVHRSTRYTDVTCVEHEVRCTRRGPDGSCVRERRVCSRYEPADTLDCLLIRWDSVPGATSFTAELTDGEGRRVSRIRVNDDSCPHCEAAGLAGDRGRCLPGEPCVRQAWPYFQAVWCLPHGREAEELTATIRPEGSSARPATIEWSASTPR